MFIHVIHYLAQQIAHGRVLVIKGTTLETETVTLINIKPLRRFLYTALLKSEPLAHLTFVLSYLFYTINPPFSIFD